VVAQLRDLLATEQSAEVANEYEYDRSLLPERRQLSLFSAPIGKGDR